MKKSRRREEDLFEEEIEEEEEAEFQSSSSESTEVESSIEIADDVEESSNSYDEPEIIPSPHRPVTPLRNVTTPDWVAPKEEKEEQKAPQNFDMLRVHQRLQILEIRINNGFVPEYGHPAYCVEMEKDYPELNETDQEIADLGNYQEFVEKVSIPTFWPPRVYDKEENKLSEEKSQKLSERIRNLHKRKFHFCLRDRTKVNREKQVIEMPKKKLKLKFSLFDYATDDEDEITDWFDPTDVLV